MKYSAAERKLAQSIVAAFPLGDAKDRPAVRAEEWPALLRAGERHGVLPLLYAALYKLGALEELPPKEREFLLGAYWQSTVGNCLKLEELGGLVKLCGDEGIPVVVLKGCALAPWLYPAEGLRSFSDVDILVRLSDRERVESLLIKNAWGCATRLDLRNPYLGQKSFQKLLPLPMHLEMHWHILDLPYYNQRIPMAWFWERTQGLVIEGRPVLVFAPTAQLLHLCAHLSIHHREPRLIWSYDLALLLTRQGEHIDWPELAEAIRDFRLTEAVRDALDLVWEAWGVRIPPEGQALLNRLRPRLSERVSNRAMAARQIAAGPAWDGLFGPSLKNRGYWRQALFPSQEYMRARYRVANRLVLSILYVWRIIAGAFKVPRSMISALVRSHHAV
jgi:hypothetical protein